jgi:O-antigen/teichoic acid export membrane protein
MNKPLNVLLKHRLLSGGAWALGGRFVTAAAGLASNALLARLLSPQEFGAYFLGFSLVLFGALVVGSGGLGLAVVRFIAESVGLNQLGRARRVVGTAFVLGVLGASGLGAAYWLFGDILAGNLFDSPALVAVTGLVAGWIAVMTLQNLVAEIFRGFHDIRLATIFGGLVTGVLLTSSLGVLWFARGQATLATILLLAVSSGLASALLASWFLRRKVASLPRGGAEGQIGVKEVLSLSWPLLMASLTFYVLTQADIWVLGAFRSKEEVAVYGATVRLVALLSMPLLIVNAVTPPLIAEMYARGEKRELERTIRTVATLASIPAFPVLVGFILVGGPILGLVYGDYYREGATVLAVLSMAQLTTFWSGSCGMLLNMTGHQYASMVITALSALAALTIALTTVNDLGMLGVALGSFSGLALQNVAMVAYTRRVVSIKPNVGLPLKLRRGRPSR